MAANQQLPPETVDQLAGLELRVRQIVEGYLSGRHRGPHRGYSVDFAEHREYAPGDDLRYVDWKVYGKHDRFYVRQFEEETNCPFQILLDATASMTYCSARSGGAVSKLEFAKLIAAALSYLILRQRDAVGLTVFGDDSARAVRPASHPGHLHHVLKSLASVEGAAGDAREACIGQAVHSAAEHLKRRCVVLIMSDFFEDLRSVEQALRRLRHGRHEVDVLQIVDPAEQDFAFEEPTVFRNLEGLETEFADPRVIGDAYRREFARHVDTLSMLCRELDINHVLLRTDTPVEAALTGYVAQRSRVRRG